jgi:hypothetical protein
MTKPKIIQIISNPPIQAISDWIPGIIYGLLDNGRIVFREYASKKWILLPDIQPELLDAMDKEMAKINALPHPPQPFNSLE